MPVVISLSIFLWVYVIARFILTELAAVISFLKISYYLTVTYYSSGFNCFDFNGYLLSRAILIFHLLMHSCNF